MPEKRSLDELKSDLTESFSIDDYLELRSRFPDEDTPLWIVLDSDNSGINYGTDFAFQIEGQLKQFEIEIGLLLGTLGGDQDDIDLLCLQTLEALSKRQKLEAETTQVV